ncbi:MAG: hypothetical protein WDA72_11320 [Desulfomonilia bacterium]|jgi:hypothetical protein|nr:hypothetical protein [Deltaproteobacteria bacterium]MDX9761851.1 hypothetical protein [Desulfomonilia bacterium]HPW69963.1 hypothetical protein [Deltaproteobacteria bacterium]
MKKSRKHGRDYVQGLPAFNFLPGCFSPLFIITDAINSADTKSNERAMKQTFPRLVNSLLFSPGGQQPDMERLQYCNNREQKASTPAAPSRTLHLSMLLAG